MKYREFIEDWFEIDDAKTGQLVPMKFNAVQTKYYSELVKLGLERGIKQPIREIILKARREGFTSLILALFAADDLMSRSPTESLVISYKYDSNKTFIKRYKNFIMSYYRRRWNVTDESRVWRTEASGELILQENGARFFCGTASARVGGRGGTVHKLLFSEAAFYPDKKELMAREIIEGSARQVDVDSGHIYIESTGNGDYNYYAKVWREAESGESRYKPRFYGWREFYTQEQFDRICSEITDKRLIKQEMPENSVEAFLASGDRFFDSSLVQTLRVEDGRVEGSLTVYDEYKPGHRYALGCDVAEGVGRHNSTIVVLDFDSQIIIDGRVYKKPKIVAVYANNRIAPDAFAHEIRSVGNRYGSSLVAIERNNHGFATLAIIKDIYFNLYRDENDRLGWHTNLASKPRMLHELRTAIHEQLIEISDKSLKVELLGYPQLDLNVSNVDELDETKGHFDRILALAIAWQMRSQALPTQVYGFGDESSKYFQSEEYDKHGSFNVV